MRLTDLPTELLWCIAKQVDFEYDLNSLVQTSRRLYDCLNGQLYRDNIRTHGNSGLVRAAMKGCDSAIRRFLVDGADVNARYPDDDRYRADSRAEVNDEDYGRTALSYAAEHGHHSVVMRLLQDARTDPDRCDKQRRTPLHWAARSGHVTIVGLMLNDPRVSPNARTDIGGSALHWASRGGHHAVVKTLLADHRVDPHALDTMLRRSPLMWAVTTDSVDAESIKMLMEVDHIDLELQDAYGRTALSFAAAAGHVGGVRLLLEKGVNVDVPDQNLGTPLSWAAFTGQSEVVELLLAAGASPNFCNHHHKTPLFLAAGQGHERVVRVLLAHDQVDPNSSNSRQSFTPLLNAAQYGHYTVVQLLLADSRVNVNTEDHAFWLALQIAKQYNHLAIVDLFQTMQGVNMRVEDKSGT